VSTTFEEVALAGLRDLETAVAQAVAQIERAISPT
jgi:hypothetical protein